MKLFKELPALANTNTYHFATLASLRLCVKAPWNNIYLDMKLRATIPLVVNTNPRLFATLASLRLCVKDLELKWISLI
jgi:hypothetical protein